MKKEKITIIGTGPVGLATAIGFAKVGYSVTCYDIDSRRIQMYQNSVVPFYELHLTEFFLALKTRLSFTCCAEASISDADYIFIAVGTPLSLEANNGVDMRAFWSAIATVERYAKSNSIVVLKSTVPVGTNAEVISHLQASRHANKIFVVSNPEFLAQGTSITDTINANRIVLGINDAYSAQMMSKLYQDFPGEKILTNPVSAELIKYFANSYLAMRISFFNDVANICGFTGAIVEDVIRGVCLDQRIGDFYCSPGCGYGGSCFPKDTIALTKQVLNKYDYNLELIQATININERQKKMLCQQIHDDCKARPDSPITILGITYKPDTDDLRYSIAVENINYLLEHKHRIILWDPFALDAAYKLYGDRVIYCSSLEEAINKGEYIFIATDWSQIAELDFGIFQGKKVYDGRNCLLKYRDKISFQYFHIGGKIN